MVGEGSNVIIVDSLVGSQEVRLVSSRVELVVEIGEGLGVVGELVPEVVQEVGEVGD